MKFRKSNSGKFGDPTGLMRSRSVSHHNIAIIHIHLHTMVDTYLDSYGIGSMRKCVFYGFADKFKDISKNGQIS